MSSVFPEDVVAALNKMDKERIRAVEFEQGLTLTFVSVVKEKSQYGAAEDSPIVERGILEEGEQFTYTFTDAEGDTRKFHSTSFPFLIAINGAEVNEGDTLLITRTGKLRDTKFTVLKAGLKAGDSAT